MATIVLKGVPVGVPERSPAEGEKLRAGIRKLREEIAATTGLSITNDEVDEAKRRGRK